MKAGIAAGETGVAVAAPGARRGRHAKPSNENNTAQAIQHLFITRLPIFRDSRKREGETASLSARRRKLAGRAAGSLPADGGLKSSHKMIAGRPLLALSLCPFHPPARAARGFGTGASPTPSQLMGRSGRACHGSPFIASSFPPKILRRSPGGGIQGHPGTDSGGSRRRVSPPRSMLEEAGAFGEPIAGKGAAWIRSGKRICGICSARRCA